MADGYWEETIDLWKAQGHMSGTDNAFDFFELEWRLVHFDSGLMFETEDVAADDTSITRRNSYGTTGRFQKARSAPAELKVLDAVRRHGDCADRQNAGS